MFRILVLVLALAAAIAGLLVGTLNPDPVALDFLLIKLNPPAGAALLGAFGIGLVCGLLIAWLMFYLPSLVGRHHRADGRTKRRHGSADLPE